MPQPPGALAVRGMAAAAAHAPPRGGGGGGTRRCLDPAVRSALGQMASADVTRFHAPQRLLDEVREHVASLEAELAVLGMEATA